MESNLRMQIFLPLLVLGLFIRATHTNNVSISEILRHPRVSGRIVKLYSGIKPEPILCSGEGFQEDPVDCAVFYRCVKGSNNKYTVFRYQCGPGTVYDPETEICNHPKSTKRINCGGYTPTLSESSNENEIDGSRQEIPLPIRQVYTEQATKAASIFSTQKFWAEDQKTTAYKSTPSVSSAYSSITTVKNHLRATRSPIPRQPNPQSGEPCTSDGFMGDSENCRKFYRCVGNGRGGYIRYEFSCSELTIWDDETQACNHAWAVKKRRCGRGGLESEKKSNEVNERPSTTEGNEVDSKQTIQSQLQISYGSKVNQVQTQISKGPVIQNQTQINYGDRTNEKSSISTFKQNQTQISHGSAVSQTQTQISHGGKGSQTQLQIDHSKEASQSQTQIHETSIDQTSAPPHDEETQHPNNEKPVSGNENNECSESGFMGDLDDCKKFYRCVDNGRGGFIKYEFTCGEGTVWDRNSEACNHAWAVKDCKNKAPSEITNQENKPTTTTSKSTTIETVPEEDEDVGYGNQNQQPSQTTVVSQDKTSTTTEVSETTQHVDTLGSPSTSGENVCTSSGFMGDSVDCKKFYRCVDNSNGGYTRYEFSCGEGTVWDSNLEACNHVWAVEKCGKETPDKNTADTTTTGNAMQDEESNNGNSPQNDNNVNKPTESATSTSITTSTSPTSSAPNNNICNASGFMGDKNDCKKFYRCVDDGKGGYTRYDFSCGDGTVWDQSIESCNHPPRDNKCGSSSSSETTIQETDDVGTIPPSNSQTTNSETNNQSSTEVTTIKNPTPADKPANNENTCSKEGFFGDTNNCKKFYRCVDNQQGGFTKYEFTCGDGTVWDPEIDACNHEYSVKKGCSTQTNEETTQQQSVQENNDYTETSTSQTSTSMTTEKTEQHQNTTKDTCESEGFFAGSANCKKFYRCVDDGKGGYTKYDFSCGDGTIWDQQSQTCNHESDENKCSENSDTSASESPPPESGSTTQSADCNNATTSTTERPETGNTEQSNSKDQCTSDGFYANSKDCKKFYRCVSNDKGGYTKYDFTCGDGTVWVQEIQACDHANDMSTCSSQGASANQTASQNGQEENTTTKPSSSTSQSTSEADNNEVTNDCSNNSTQPNECKSEGFYPNNNDCRKFYRCVDNGQGGYTKYDFTCGEGTAWDSDIQACNHINEVKNCQGLQGENQSEQGNTAENSSQTTEENGTTKTTTESSKTTTTTESGDNKQPVGNDRCEKEGYFGDSNNCQKFYRCVDNGNGGLTKYDFTCGEGTIWDQDIQTCNHPGDVQNPSCNNNTTTSSATTEASSGTSSTSSGSSSTSSEASSSSTTEGQDSSDCSQGSTQKPQKNQVNCTKAGFYADPDDCKKFYRCVDWNNNGQRFSVYHFDCGEGTIWDPELETCNHEDSVYPPRDCSGTQNQNSEESTSTTTTTTTTEKSTTQETSTTEETTTQQSPTDSSTTQESTTTDTTTEQSTTQKSTTTEKSTTEQSSTTQQSTTEKSTTTEQSTTEQSTTKQSTTEQSTTEQSTTQQSSTTEQASTTEQSTTESSTTEQSNTTEQSSTTQSTEETTTTEQSTTQETTEGSTEQSSTTEESTTQESSTTEQTTDSSTTEQTTESSTTEQSSSSTTEQSSDGTTTDNNQESTTEGSSSGTKDCPETEDDQYLYVCPTSFKRHPKYCNMFYQCTEDNDTHDLDIAVFKCPNNTIYDESKTQCVDEDKADKKCDGEKAERRRVKRLGVNYKEPIVASKDRLACPSTGHFPFEKSECSPAFLKCDKTKYGKLRGYVNQCPDGYVYWSISRRCEAKYKVKGCKMTANDWTGRWEIPIERNNVSA